MSDSCYDKKTSEDGHNIQLNVLYILILMTLSPRLARNALLKLINKTTCSQDQISGENTALG